MSHGRFIWTHDRRRSTKRPEAASLIGIDPTAARVAKYYKPHIKVVYGHGRAARVVRLIATADKTKESDNK